ncbi:hypothetical protein GQ473_04095 [archaeon]|nr:hypothetical protein [archaeon]
MIVIINAPIHIHAAPPYHQKHAPVNPVVLVAIQQETIIGFPVHNIKLNKTSIHYKHTYKHIFTKQKDQKTQIQKPTS